MPPLNAVPARISAGLRAAARRWGDVLGIAAGTRKITGHRLAGHYPMGLLRRPGLADLLRGPRPARLLRAGRLPCPALAKPLAFALTLLLAAASSAPAKDGEFIEDNGFYRVTIGGRIYRLEALTVRRAEATGRLPVALIAHGKPANPQGMLDDHAVNFTGVAHDLASRGWLAVVVIRRGFGQSDGPMPVPVNCRTTSFMPRFASDADDLEAALEAIAARPDADASRVIAIGVSAGGAAVSALAARNPKNLRAVINVSGGLRMESCAKDDMLVQAFKELGAKSRVPALWMYAKNDSYFPPDIVGRMHEAFLGAGGDVKFVMFDAIGTDGHTMFSTGAGRYRWLPEMDGFLRFRGLPTWRRQDVDVLLKRLNGLERNRSFVEGYLAAPFEKALARKLPDNHLFGGWGYKSVGDARKGALEGCGRQRPTEHCVIVMENNDWVGQSQ
jgi:dienelactone hydrolase